MNHIDDSDSDDDHGSDDSDDEEEENLSKPYPFLSFTSHSPLVLPLSVKHSEKVTTTTVPFSIPPAIMSLFVFFLFLLAFLFFF